MDWKKRLLIEYSDLREKIEKLDNYLADNYDFKENVIKIDNKKHDILSRQLKVMNEYLDILEERILLEMKD